MVSPNSTGSPNTTHSREVESTPSSDHMCQYMLSLSHVTTLNGKFEIVVFIFLFLLIVSSNTVLIYSMIKTNEIKTNTSKFMMALSVGDLVAALALIPTHIAIVHLQRFSCIGYSIKQFFEVFLGTSATLLTFGMGFDRYLFISKPHLHSSLESKVPPVLLIGFVVIYTISFAFGGCVVALVYSSASMRFATVFNLVSIVVYVLVLSSSLLVNGLLLSYIRKQTKQIRRLSNTHIQSSYQQRATKTVAFISCIQFMTIAPWLISLLFMTFGIGEDEFILHADTIYYVHLWLKMPMFVYSFLNSLVFLFRNRVLVKFIKSKICKNKENQSK